MSDDFRFLQQLHDASNSDERRWLVSRRLLDSLPADLATAAYAVAIPHWFDTEILAALCPELKSNAEDIYTELQTLPFIEPFEGRGHNIHELTRRLMLQYLWQERREEYLSLSQRAAKHFEEKAIKSKTEIVYRPLRIEQIYHLLIAEPERGADAVRDQGLVWHDEFDYTYASVSALANAVREQVEAERVQGRGKSWGIFWEGMIATSNYQFDIAINNFTQLIASSRDDKQLTSQTYFRLGEVYLQLSEPRKASIHYKEALPLYQAVGDKLGEANCIQSLGDVHLQLDETGEARARYEEALSLYRAIGDMLGEANCILGLGDVYLELDEPTEARAHCEEALSLYRAIGNKRGEANCILGLGDVALQEKDFAQTIKLYEEAVALGQTISHADEAEALDRIANAYDEQKEYAKAIQAYTRALELFPSHTHILRNRIKVYLKLRDSTNAAKDIEASERLQPDNPYLFLRKGELANLLRDYDEALSHFQSALRLLPRLNYAYFGMGLVYLKTEQFARALEAYRQGLTVSDGPSDLEEAVDELRQLKSEEPTLAGIDEVVELLQNWEPGKA